MSKPKTFKIAAVIALSVASQFAKAQHGEQTIESPRPLGEVTIIGYRDTLNSSNIKAEDIAKYNRLDVGQALNLLPGITLSGVGPRNESAVNVRGFDLKQVPIYLDGIPVYVPYDGYVDLARFTTFDIADIQVAKGYSSVLYGPNAEGGAINLITRRPEKKLDLNYSAGWLSGGYRINAGVGSRVKKFYYQVDASQLKRDFFPMSKDFSAKPNEDGGRRNNSYNSDSKISGKIGFIPREGQEYALGYAYQIGSKGNPVYAGTDPANALLANPRFWKWPDWDKQNVYFISNNRINASNTIKTRWYWDQFKNTLKSFDNANYIAQTRGYAFTSIYDDYTLGNSITFENTSIANNSFSIAGHFKQDVHRENNVGEPQRKDADNNFTIGAEDTYHISSKFTLNAGLSYMLRKSVATEQYNSTTRSIYSLPANSNDALNVQGLARYAFNPANSLSFSVARRTRFATIKDRYSFRLGTAIPNPDLKAETALNYDLSYRGSFGNGFTLEASGFYSKIGNSIQTVNNVTTDPVTGAALSQVQNTGKAEYYGAETGIRYNVATGLELNANYTYVIRNNIASPNIRFTDVPKHKVFASLLYRPIPAVYILASTEYNSDRYSTSYGTMAKGFGLGNIKANGSIMKGLISAEVGVNNLFDRNYQLVEGYPQAGRNWFTTLLFHY